MSASRQIQDHEPLMVAWKKYLDSSEYQNTFDWAAHEANRKGSLWAAFSEGFTAATRLAGDLHESVDPASDEERLNHAPGAGAMGAVIEYRDLIRKSIP